MVLFASTKRKRSFLGRFLDREGLTQEWLIKESRVSRNTISRLCTNKDYTPHIKTAQAIIKALNKNGYKTKLTDFFNV